MRFGKKQITEKDTLNILEKVIINIVSDKQGCKLMELITDITNAILNEKRLPITISESAEYPELLRFNSSDTNEKVNTLLDTIIGLVDKNKLVALHYKLGIGNYHEKMFILPKGSSFKILSRKNQNE